MRHVLCFSALIVTLLCSTVMLQGCAVGVPKRTGIETVDRVFPANNIMRKELQDTANDILKRHDGSGVAIVVKYHFVPPYTSSADLAHAQGNKIRAFLVKQGIKAPMAVSITPTSDPNNTIWISYHALRAKGDGLVYDQ